MKTDLFVFYLFVLFSNVYLVKGNISKEVKCQVCKATMIEMEEAISKVDSRKIIEVGGSRLDSTGNLISNSIPLRQSEVYLTELMESICDKMDDYAKARYKSNGRLTVLKLMTPEGMNPDMSAVDFIQDGDLNKSLKHYCLEILEDQEEEVLKFFMTNNIQSDVDLKLCGEVAGYCNEKSIDDYELEQDDTHYEL